MEDNKKNYDEELDIEDIDDLEPDKLFPECTCMRSDKLKMLFDFSGEELLKYEGSEDYVKIPYGVNTIGPAAFSYNAFLSYVDIPDSVEKIDDYAFYFCPYVGGPLGNNVKYIGKYAFVSGDGEYRRVEFPDSVEYIGESAFSLLIFDKLPKNLKHIGTAAFMRSMWCREGALRDDSLMFSEEEWYAEIPDKVTTIEEFAFFDVELGCGCRGIWIPLSVKKIGKKAFGHYPKFVEGRIHTLYYEGSEEQWKAIDIDNSDNWLNDIEVKFNCKPI